MCRRNVWLAGTSRGDFVLRQELCTPCSPARSTPCSENLLADSKPRPWPALADLFARMLDVLSVDGPSTASAIALRTGQAVGSASHHLKVLAEAGLIVEAPELARDRRERWWRRATATRWSRAEFATDAGAVTAAWPRRRSPCSASSSGPGTGSATPRRRESGTTPAFATQTWVRLTPSEAARAVRGAGRPDKTLATPRHPRRRSRAGDGVPGLPAASRPSPDMPTVVVAAPTGRVRLAGASRCCGAGEGSAARRRDHVGAAPVLAVTEFGAGPVGMGVLTAASWPALAGDRAARRRLA